MLAGSTTHAAFSGFRLVREHPRAIAIWAVVCLGFSLAEGLFAAATAGSGVMQFLALASRPNANPDEIIGSFVRIAPTYLILMSANVAFYALFLAATNRALSASSGERYGYLRVGVEELRQFGTLSLLLLITIAVYLALAVVGSLIGAAAAMAGGSGVSLFLTAVTVIIGLGYVWMRFSLASPLSFATGRVDVFGSWALTRGRMWVIGRVYLLTFTLAGVAYLIGMTLIVALMAAPSGGVDKMMTLASPDLGSVVDFLSAPRLILLALQAALSALILPVVLCPAVEIYRGLANDTRRIEGGTPGHGPWA